MGAKRCSGKHLKNITFWNTRLQFASKQIWCLCVGKGLKKKGYHFDSHIALKISLPWIHSQVTHWTLLHSLVSEIFVDILLMTQPAQSERTMNDSEDKMNQQLSKLEKQLRCHLCFIILIKPLTNVEFEHLSFKSWAWWIKKWQHYFQFRKIRNHLLNEQTNKKIQYPKGTPQS